MEEVMFSVPGVCVRLCGFVEPKSCTTAMVQSYIVHHWPAWQPNFFYDMITGSYGEREKKASPLYGEDFSEIAPFSHPSSVHLDS